MPLYDCGDRECDECRRAFGLTREKAISRFEAREIAYASLEKANQDQAETSRLPSQNGASHES